MPKKVPMRTCIGCGSTKEKKELLRIVMTPEGAVLADPTGRRNGRGAYLGRDPECLRKAVKRMSLQRAFRCQEILPVSLETLAEQIGGPDAG